MVFFLILEAIELEVNLFPIFLEWWGMIEPLLTSFNMFFPHYEHGNHLDLDLGLGKIGERKGMNLVFVIIVYFFYLVLSITRSLSFTLNKL